ncbi:fibronectin type III domain-containing protein [Streptomyces sp. NPDC089799]|uniref:fibronectin type III domain-containing protein n=1 Tax=Streptomyces sp. NPDC089799 TaxID=3155066 RepID=UPI003433B8EB
MTTRTRLGALAATAVLAAAGGLITATPASAATCASTSWTARYFANTSFSGTPKLTACDTAIAEDYGYGDPVGVTLPKDNFSVRWSLTRDFGSGGPFRFSAATQDGMRVYVDGVRRIDLWKNVSTTARKTVDLNIPAGPHTIRVDYVAWTGQALARFTYAPRTEATVDTVAPLTPTGVTAAYDRTTAKTTLSWAANKEMDLAGYRVYRRLSSTQWARVSGSALLTSRSFGDAPPATGQTFLYEVRAVDKAGRESAGSTDVSAATVDRTAPAAPRGVTAVFKAGTGIVVSWTPSPGSDVTRYQLHRNGHLYQDRVQGSSTYTDMTVEHGSTYSYTVVAVDAAGNKSPASGSASATTDGDLVAPAPVSGLKATPRQDGVFLEWTPNTEPDLKRYEVFKAEKYDDGDGGFVWLAHRVEYLGEDAVSFLHGSEADGETVMYAVIAVDDWGNQLGVEDGTVNWVEVTELGSPAAG